MKRNKDYEILENLILLCYLNFYQATNDKQQNMSLESHKWECGDCSYKVLAPCFTLYFKEYRVNRQI